MHSALKNGTVLPEHHRGLIDANTFLAWLIFKGYIDNAKCGEVAEAIRKTTIVPATNEKNCENCGNFYFVDDEIGYECGVEVGCVEHNNWIPKLTVTEEQNCENCGQPRDNKGRCILFKEGKCVDIHEKWIPATKDTEKEFAESIITESDKAMMQTTIKEYNCEHCANAKDYSEDGFYCKANEMYCRADVSCEKFKPITENWVEDLD